MEIPAVILGALGIICAISTVLALNGALADCVAIKQSKSTDIYLWINALSLLALIICTVIWF